MEGILKLFEVIEMIVRIKGIVIILILDLILNFEWYNMFVICIVREFGKWYFCFFRVILKCYGF